MTFTGFAAADFQAMGLAGFQPRMAAIKETVRPKLTALGEIFAPRLAQLLQEPVYAHVAKHMRRTVNPPDDTWVAFSTSPRGYKALPHFQVGIWRSHLFARWGVIYECPDKRAIGERFQKGATLILETTGSLIWSGDHKEPGGQAVDAAGLQALAKRLATVKSAELLCGLAWAGDDPLVGDPDALLAELDRLFSRLAVVHRLAVANPAHAASH